jgi:hypothetical protein
MARRPVRAQGVDPIGLAAHVDDPVPNRTWDQLAAVRAAELPAWSARGPVDGIDLADRLGGPCLVRADIDGVADDFS